MCGKLAARVGVQCHGCADKRREYFRMRRGRMMLSGCCDCGAPREPGRVRCETHLKKIRDAVKALRKSKKEAA